MSQHLKENFRVFFSLKQIFLKNALNRCPQRAAREESHPRKPHKMKSESPISSNIRAIIEQLQLNPVERRRLIDRAEENTFLRKKLQNGAEESSSASARVSIGVYGCKDYEMCGGGFVRRSEKRNPDAKPRPVSMFEQKVLEEAKSEEVIASTGKLSNRAITCIEINESYHVSNKLVISCLYEK